MDVNPQNNHRILIIDDNRAIHEDFRKILGAASEEPSTLFTRGIVPGSVS